MSESKGLTFNCVKYILIASYVLSCIGFILYIIGGVLIVSIADIKSDADDEQQITDDHRMIIKITGYVLIIASLIGIPISVLGIYAVYKELYRWNFWLTILSVIGLFLTLLSQTKIMVIVIQAVLTGCQLYYTLRLKKTHDYSMDDNNPELGKVKPNENSAMIMNAYQQ